MPPFGKTLLRLGGGGGFIESENQRHEAKKAQAMLRNGYANNSPFARDYDPMGRNGPYLDRNGRPSYRGTENCRGPQIPWFQKFGQQGPRYPNFNSGPRLATPGYYPQRFGQIPRRNNIPRIIRGVSHGRGRRRRRPHYAHALSDAEDDDLFSDYPDDSGFYDSDEDSLDAGSLFSSEDGSWERRRPRHGGYNRAYRGPYRPNGHMRGRMDRYPPHMDWDDGSGYETRGGMARVPGRFPRDPYRTGGLRGRSMSVDDWSTDGGY